MVVAYINYTLSYLKAKAPSYKTFIAFSKFMLVFIIMIGLYFKLMYFTERQILEDNQKYQNTTIYVSNNVTLLNTVYETNDKNLESYHNIGNFNNYTVNGEAKGLKTMLESLHIDHIETHDFTKATGNLLIIDYA